MRKILLFGTALCVATSALAFGGIFGGGSGSSKQVTYSGGADAIGVHFNGNPVVCPENSENIDGICKCVEGYVANDEGACVANQCLEFVETDCAKACDPVTGEISYATLCHDDAHYCNEAHECINPCDEAEYNDCQTCTPIEGAAQINNKPNDTRCPDTPSTNNYICNDGICINPCTQDSTTCITYTAEDGTCVSTINSTVTCDPDDEHRICGETGDCNACEEGYELYNGECVVTCEVDSFRDIDGVCHPCSISTYYQVREETNCTNSCPARHIETNTNGDMFCVYGTESVSDVTKICFPMSVCVTCSIDSNGNSSYSYLPSGTPCVQGGIDGSCSNGLCVPSGATSCSSAGSCPEGYFCNYGGTKAPSVCEKVNAQTVTIGETTYYYNSLEDLLSWCRTGYRSFPDCTWGYLSKYAARDWCQSLGKNLIYLADVTDELVNALPKGKAAANNVDDNIFSKYWLEDGRLQIYFDNYKWRWQFHDYLARQDGFAYGACVVCKQVLFSFNHQVDLHGV